MGPADAAGAVGGGATAAPCRGETVVESRHFQAGKWEGTPKWLVYRENPIKMDDLGGPIFQEINKSSMHSESATLDSNLQSPVPEVNGQKWIETTSGCFTNRNGTRNGDSQQ